MAPSAMPSALPSSPRRWRARAQAVDALVDAPDERQGPAEDPERERLVRRGADLPRHAIRLLGDRDRLRRDGRRTSGSRPCGRGCEPGPPMAVGSGRAVRASASATAAAARSPASQRYQRCRSWRAAARAGSAAASTHAIARSSEVDGRPVLADQHRGLGGADEELDPIDRRAAAPRRRRAPQLERAQVVAVGVEEGVAQLGHDPPSIVAASARRASPAAPSDTPSSLRPSEPAAAPTGPSTRSAARRLERQRHTPHAAAPARPGSSVGVDDLLQQGVAGTRNAGRPCRPPAHEDPPVDDLAQRLAHDRPAAVPTTVDEQFVVDPRAGRRGDPEHLLAGLGHRRDTCEHDSRSRAGRAPSLVSRDGRQDLLGVERVAAGPLQRPVDEVRLGRPAELVGDEARQVVAVEPLEVEPIDALPALELGEVGQSRRAAARASSVRIVATSRTRSSRRFRTRKATRSRVDWIGPLEVLDDEDDRRARASRSSTPRTSSNRRTWANRSSLPACQPDALPGSAAAGRPGRARSSGISRASSPRVGTEQRRQRTRIELAEQVAEAPRRTGRTAGRRSRAAGIHRSGPGRPSTRRDRRTRRRAASCRSRPRPATITARVSPAAARAKAASEPAELRRPRDERLAARGIHDPAMIGAPSAPTRCLGAATVATPTLVTARRRRPRVETGAGSGPGTAGFSSPGSTCR